MIFTIESGESLALSEGELEIEMGNAYALVSSVPTSHLTIQLTIEEDELQYINENTPNWNSYTTDEKFNCLKEMWRITIRINYLKQRLTSLNVCIESDDEYKNGGDEEGDQEEGGEFVMEDETMNNDIECESVNSIDLALEPTDISTVLNTFINMQVS